MRILRMGSLVAILCCPAFLHAQPAAFCPGNLVQNGGFTNGVVVPSGSSGSIPPSTVANWTAAYQTPQIAQIAGCRDANYITQWGNQAVGEAVQQQVAFAAGVTYEIQFCARYRNSNINFSNVQFRASTASLPDTSCPSGTCEVIGTTPNITAAMGWTNQRFCWTPTRNYSFLTFSTTNNINVNDGNQVSWADVDNICITRATTPVITGPPTSCTIPSTYCVSAPVAGVTYTWAVTGGTIVGSNTGTCVVINWNAPAGGTVSVTTSGATCPMTGRLQVKDCGHDNCCRDAKLSVGYVTKSHVATLLPGNVVTTTPSVTAPWTPTTVKATIISASHTLSAPVCGSSGPINAFGAVNQPPPPAGYTGPFLPVLGSNQVVWESQSMSLTPLNAVAFPFNIQLPPVPSAPPGTTCTETVNLCVVYDITSTCCRTCSLTRCFSLKRTSTGIIDINPDFPIE